MEQLGSVVGLAMVVGVYALLGQTRIALIVSYVLLAIMLVAGLVVAVTAIDEPPAHRAPWWLATRPITATVTAPWIRLLGDLLAPFKHNDFLWVFATRALMTLGLVITVGVMPYYFAEVVGLPNPTMASAAFGLMVVLAAVASALWSGQRSDRAGRRKKYVFFSSGLQAAVAVVLVFGLPRSLPLIFGLGLVYGLGFGAYIAVDWALACDVLPDRNSAAGKDMGLWHASLTVPTVVGPALLAVLLSYLEQSGQSVLGVPTGGHLGFRVGFGIAALAYALGTVMVTRIRGAR
jgi:Na+/melibiose symporter-like transporter